MVDWFLIWLRAYIAGRCKHPGSMVVADILEGDARDVAVKYCRACGAVKAIRGVPGPWRTE